MSFNGVPELEIGSLVVSVIGVEVPVISIEQDGSDMALHEYEARALYEWLGRVLGERNPLTVSPSLEGGGG